MYQETKAQSGSKYGRYIYTILSISDVLILNALFIGLMAMNHHLDLSAKMRTAWLVLNLAYIPVAINPLIKQHNRRAIVMDRILRGALIAVGTHALFFLALLEFININLGINFYIEFYSFLVVIIPLWWIFNRHILKTIRRHGRNFVRVVIVGSNRTAHRLYDTMTADPGYGYEIIGFFDDQPLEGMPGKYIGKIADLGPYLKEHAIDEVYFTLSGEMAESLTDVVKITDDNVCQFFYVPQISQYVNSGYELHNIGTMPVLSLRHNPLKNPVNQAIKRTFDIAFSSAFLIVSPIIFIPVAIAIKASSPGPVFFKQKRTGYMGRSFNCLKFRTMKVNSNADKAQATKDDPRKTHVGDFLRRTSLDELPQFINVFLGDMSIVGPRPHMLKHTEDYTRIIDQYMVRHVVKPGITGWAQVNGYRGLTDQLWKMEKRVEYDVWYIEHWNMFLDIKIIARTIMNAVHGEKNAF